MRHFYKTIPVIQYIKNDINVCLMLNIDFLSIFLEKPSLNYTKFPFCIIVYTSQFCPFLYIRAEKTLFQKYMSSNKKRKAGEKWQRTS